MNFIQRNPNDPKHEEFHSGEYEFWPLDTPVKTKSSSFPSALLNGLELIAAAVAAGLLALALSTLYVLSAPLAIEETNATINANAYNAEPGETVAYTLALKVKPDRILLEGELEDDRSTLFLRDLSGGTTYLLRYYNEEGKLVGTFQFTTPADEDPAQELPAESAPETVPEGTGPTNEAPEETSPAPADDPQDETVAETQEETQEPTPPAYYPPANTPQAPPTPEEPPEETTEETTEETPEETPEDTPEDPAEQTPSVNETDISQITVRPGESGDLFDVFFQITEVHSFQNISAGDFTLQVLVNGDLTDNYTYELVDGTLSVSVTSDERVPGESQTIEVTVTTGSGSYTSTSTIAIPSLESAGLTVTKNADGTYTFDMSASIDSDGDEEMVCEANLWLQSTDIDVTLPMTAQTKNLYTATYTTAVDTDADVTALLIVTGWWSRLSSEDYTQSVSDSCTLP